MKNVKINHEEKLMGRDKENNAKWRKENIRRYEFYINKEENPEIIDFLANVESKQALITELLKKEIERRKTC